MGLHSQCPDEPKTTVLVWEDADHPGPALDLLVQPLQHVGALEVLVMPAW
jgi:hypothetical protein